VPVPTSATVFFKPSAIIRSLFCNCLSTTTIYRPRKEITRGYQREDNLEEKQSLRCNHSSQSKKKLSNKSGVGSRKYTDCSSYS